MSELFSPKYGAVIQYRSMENRSKAQYFVHLGLDFSSFKLKNFSTVPNTRIMQNANCVGAELYTDDGINFRLMTNDPNHFLTASDVYKLIGNYKYFKYGIH